MRFCLLAFAFCLLASGSAQGQWLDTTVTIGDTMGAVSLPSKVVANPLTGRVYVANEDWIQLFDPVTLTKTGRLPYLGEPFACPEAGRIYLVSGGSTALTVVDATADTLLYSRALPFVPTGIAYSRTSRRLYFTSGRERDPVLVYDPLGDTVVKEIAIASPARAVAWDSIHDRVYVGLRTHAGRLAVIGCAQDSLIGYVTTGLRETRHLAVSAVQHKLYCYGVMDTTSEVVMLVVNTDSLRTVGRVMDAPEPAEMLYNQVFDRLYCPSRDVLYIVDCGRDSIRGRLYLGYDYDMDVEYSPLTGRVYAASEEMSTIAVVDSGDTVALMIPATGPAGQDPYALGFSAEHNQLYCGLTKDLVFVIDASVDTVAGTMDYSPYSIRGIVHNPAGNRLYVLCPYEDLIFVLDQQYRIIKRIYGGVRDKDAIPVLHTGLNRLFVADRRWVRVIDCNTDSLVDSMPITRINDPLPVLLPDMNKLYVFPKGASSHYRRAWVYDCLRHTLIDTVWLGEDVPCAVYHPRSGHIYFAREDDPIVGVLDPIRDSVIKTLEAGNSCSRGRMLAKTDGTKVYFTNNSSNMLYVIDVLSDSVTRTLPLPTDMDSILWHRGTGKLYMVDFRGTVRSVLVFDCARDTFVGALQVTPDRVGLMNERNDKLCLGTPTGIAVVDCRYDSVISLLPEMASPYYAALNQAYNRMYFAQANNIAVYADDPTGIVEQAALLGRLGFMLHSNPVRERAVFRCQVPAGQVADFLVYDVTGRLVSRSAIAGREGSVALVWDGRDSRGTRVASGIYFCRLETPASKATVKVVFE